MGSTIDSTGKICSLQGKGITKRRYKGITGERDKGILRGRNKGIIRGKKILDCLIPFLKGAKTVFIFIPKDDEVDTSGIISYLFDKGYRVIVPKCRDDYTMAGIRISCLDELKAGAYGVFEPEDGNEVDKGEIDLFIVPGTLFDRKLNRKGRGLGYFDRFLSDVKGKKTIIGLCKESQVVDHLDANEWDVPVDLLICEETIFPV
ncbi:5-formyltetrahydrofolate cyclo-ligase [Candidatus Woesearchaeota archaeon]|nr:5-formyltetrahydrofolate cyclo-ligase [Candidatus Woesearchaeota archaeon]